MYSKIDETGMTPTSFSMNTILTNEKEKLDGQLELHTPQPPPQQQHQQQQQNQQLQQSQQQLQQEQQQQQPPSGSTEEEDDSPKKEELSSEGKHVHVTLEESELWKKFKSLTNEMIVTKNGR